MGALIAPRAGQPAEQSQLIDVTQLIQAYFQRVPDAGEPTQRVAFGTSGHRGSSLAGSFNEAHILAITQAICAHRERQGITGPLFIGIDTHALSQPASATALEVLAANHVHVLIAENRGFTPTPVISHAILAYNRGRSAGLADGIVVTPSHNPPGDGGFKYNPPNGGPADTTITSWIEDTANALLADKLAGVRRIPVERGKAGGTIQEHDFISAYVGDLGTVIDMKTIAASGLHMAVDPLGGAGVGYWGRIADHYQIDLTVISDVVDPTFAFMSVDWDGRIRMDPSSPYAMRRLIGLKDGYDIAFACDTDHDRHGIVAPSVGLMPANHFLAVATDYLFRNRPSWNPGAMLGKTVVSSALIDRVARRLERPLFEVPVGFKWFVDGLFSGAVGFGGEESAGASFLRRDGTTWTTDKDGIAAALLSAEVTARGAGDPGELYRELTQALGDPRADRVEAKATAAQRAKLSQLARGQILARELAGEPIQQVLDHAPGNGAPIGGIKVIAASGWFAARPSGTEDIYKIYAESFRGDEHLRTLLVEAQDLVDRTIASA